MNASCRLLALPFACLILFLAACGASPQSLIVGKWEAESALKVTAEFHRDGTANLTMFGQTLRGRYKVTADGELEWIFKGTATKHRFKVTPTELEVMGDGNIFIKYRRQ